jgi:hypothetical protein
VANVTGWWAEVSTAVTVPQMSATALLKPPGVSSVSPLNPSPPRMSATATMAAPALGLSTTITIPRMTATGAMAVPAVSNAVNAAITAPRMAATGSMPTPAVSVWGDVAPPRMASTAAMRVPAAATINGSTFSDLFNRSNSSTLGASWNTDAGIGASLTIASNAAIPDGGGIGGNIYTTAMATGNNQITVVMKGTPTAGDFVSIGARCNLSTDTSAASSLVLLTMVQGSLWTLYRSASDTGVNTAGNQSWADGDTIDFTCVGGTLTVKRNGATVLTTGGATDLGAGYISLTVEAASIGLDSFTAQDI